jgi:hypothetical protein
MGVEISLPKIKYMLTNSSKENTERSVWFEDGPVFLLPTIIAELS